MREEFRSKVIKTYNWLDIEDAEGEGAWELLEDD